MQEFNFLLSTQKRSFGPRNSKTFCIHKNLKEIIHETTANIRSIQI